MRRLHQPVITRPKLVYNIYQIMHSGCPGARGMILVVDAQLVVRESSLIHPPDDVQDRNNLEQS